MDLLEELRRCESLLDCTMLSDRFKLRRLAKSVRQAADRGKPFDRQLSRLTEQLRRSVELFQWRQANVPQPAFPDDLPINLARDQIQQAIQREQVVIVCGETGSGKSTQLPKICLAAGRGIAGTIGHTQPRRLAARSVAARIAEELGSVVGQHVGFKIRFTDKASPKSFVKLMTDGILLAETQSDRYLEQYDTLIIDEAHERSLNIDFLLGYLRQLLDKRRDLKLIITSATIDAERFAEHFPSRGQPARIIEVSGRGYPVDVRYRPPDESDPEASFDPHDGIVAGVEELCGTGGGDILVFLPTEREIRDVAKRLRGWALHRGEKPAILPLYARLPNSEQNRIFNSGGPRRIVLATNVAESSLTVPGIRYVVDTGTARISRYSPRSKVQRLPIESVSRASADQRAGRCGRVAPGICIRLYGEEDYLTRRQFTTPEIRRTNLAAVILRMLALKLGDIESFPFLDPPQQEAVRDGYRTLFELGATDRDGKLTEIGERMSHMPVDPRIARMILAAFDERCLAEMLIIASALEVQDPRDRPVEKEKQADECHARFSNSSSDFMSYLKLWDYFHERKAELSQNKLRKACRDSFLSFNRMREWLDVHRQLKQIVGDSGIRPAKRQDDYSAIHRSLLTGLLSNVAKRVDKRSYQGLGGVKSYIWPGSHLFKEPPEWIMAAEVVETSQRYLRCVARINRNWIEPRADHLVERTYRDPHWSRKRDTVIATEKVSLFRLPVETKRGRKYGKIDPAVARHLFLRHALVQGDLNSKLEFFVSNQALIEQLALQAAKSRDSGYLISEAAQYDFYDSLVPADVHDTRSLRQWMKRAKREETDRLFMTSADFVDSLDESPVTANFPDVIQAGEIDLRVDYHFEPGEETDGASVTVPIEALDQLESYQLEWGVPGLLHEKVTAMIRSLPKAARRNLIPAPDVAAAALETVRCGEGPFLPTIAQALSRQAGEPIAAAEFQTDSLPQHLKVNIRVVDGAGKVLSHGRDLDELRRQLGVEAREGRSLITDPDWNKDGLTCWDFGELPASIALNRGGYKITGFPMLVDQGDSVALRLSGNKEAARQTSRLGVRRLIVLAEARELREQIAWLPRLNEIALITKTLPYRVDLQEDLQDLLADLAFLGQRELPRDESEFAKMRELGGIELPGAVQDLAKIVAPLFDGYHQACLHLLEIEGPKWEVVRHDIMQQIGALLAEGFLKHTPVTWLAEYPRYFNAALFRIEQLKSGSLQRDLEMTEQLSRLTAEYSRRRADHQQRGIFDAELERYRWMLEEFRVSLFAQRLGTSLKVSPERLEKQWMKTKL